ncbi:flotillin family protein [Furfurilactobacillus entadae]|uniref:flotillin family protein n=1 Tax=Furfurilactobacillus entadae TaxID=2922307 RepID=UPI0035E711AF
MEILLGGLGILIILIIVILLISYRKAGPNEVLVITGGALRGPFVQGNEITHSRVKIVKGGGVFVIPIIQQAQVQTLDTFNIDVTVDNIMTSSMVPVNASANAVLRVSSDPELIAVAAEKTLGLDAQERDAQMTEIVKGSLREVLSALTPKEANNRSDFQNKVRDSIVSTFETLGLEITNLQITSINDNNGYYENLAAQEIADKQARAEKAKAEADRVARLARAENDQEAKKAELQADQAIAEN